jgi:hypothetical protein
LRFKKFWIWILFLKTFEAISGKTGLLIWTFDNDVRSTTMNFYTPLYLNKDFDNDGFNDLITIHGGDPIRKPRILIQRILFFE